MKYDVSERSHDQATPKPGGLLRRTLVNLSGIPANLAYKHGGPQELSDLMAAGAVLLGSSTLSAVTATAGFHLALGDGGFHVLYVLAGAGVGGLTGLNDFLIQYKATLAERGRGALRKVGLNLPPLESSQVGPQLIRSARVVQAATFGFLGGLFFIIAGNASDVRAYVDQKFMTANKAVAVEASKLVDAGIARSKQALLGQESEVANVSRSLQALRSSDVRRAVSRNSRSPAAVSNPQIEKLEQRLADETAKRNALMVTVNTQESNRNAAIEKIINESPNAVRKKTGLSAQVEALTALTTENPKLLILILAVEFLSLMLELGPLWAASTKIPSALAARIALDHYIEVSALAKEGADKLGARRVLEAAVADPASPVPANTNDVPSAAPDAMPKESNHNDQVVLGSNGASAPRRPRGRPRKNGLDRLAEEPGHE